LLPAAALSVVEISERVALDAAADAGGADAGAADAGGADDTGIGGAEATKPHHVAAPPRVLTGVAVVVVGVKRKGASVTRVCVCV